MVHSINVQAICDSDCIFVHVDVSWSDSVHGSRIFKNSDAYERFTTGDLDGILLGDNRYAITQFLLTPFLAPNSPAEENYNRVYKLARYTVERSFGQVIRVFYRELTN